MARRPADGSDGFARLRPALVAHRRRITVPPPEAAPPAVIADAAARCDEYEQLVMSGVELVLDSVTLHGAFFRLGEDVSEYRFERDRDGRRRWVLTTDDQLVEVTPFEHGVWTRVAWAADGEP